ncbi:hypothetical protein Tco_0301051 [Tanacetum coccineum]
MTTLADKAILSGADNRPPMLEKNMYDSWKSRIELYMMNRQHGRMILESIENGPLIWPSIEENRVTRPKKYSELSATEAIQADCDIKPPPRDKQISFSRTTTLRSMHCECKLYDECDKFAYKKGETLHEFYSRFALLLNDMNISNMKLEQFQVNTKFLNTLPPEWSKFVTDVKLFWDFHTTNIDQLHAYLGQHEFHANEVRLMYERNSNPLAFVASHQMTQSPYQTHQNSYQNTQFQPQVSPYQSLQYESPHQSQQYSTHQSSTPLSITYPSNDYQSSIHHNVYSPSSSIPQLEYAPSRGDDPIDAINHVMSFLTVVVTSRYPTTNNQLRNSSNPRQQATINDGRVTFQPIQGRQTSFDASTESQEDNDKVMGGEQEDEEDEELYGDLNLNLDKRDAEMTYAQTNQEMEEVHVTLTTEPPVVQQQSSSISSDLVSKFINPSLDIGIDSILNPNVQSDIPVNVSVSATTETPSPDTIIPQPPIPIIQSQQQIHDSTTTTTIPITTLPEISTLHLYLMKDAVNVAVQLQSNKLRKESQAENDEFLKQIDSNIKAIIKDQVKGQVSKIMPKVEKYVTESLGAKVLARSSNQPQTSYAAAASLSEFELKKILIDKIEENK